MFKAIFSKFVDGAKKDNTSSAFSRFFREASSGEKKKVFLDVAKRASREQQEVIRKVRLAR
ncbi:MAG: hypothetical protein WCX27_03120 [Candidatus Paceibacterota bacterium]|jgi:hypothetical protein